MTVLLYGVMTAATELAGRGLDERPLRSIMAEELSGVVSDHDDAPAPTEENMWAYESVVEHLMTHGALVPARFGTTAPDDEPIRGMLLARSTELHRTLGFVSGAVEIAVHAPLDAPVDAPSDSRSEADPSVARASRTSGTAYLLSRLAERREAEQLVAAIDASVSPLVRAKRRRPTAPNRLAYLVDVNQVDEFIARIDELGAGQLTWTGPWPPYSFTTPPAGETP